MPDEGQTLPNGKQTHRTVTMPRRAKKPKPDEAAEAEFIRDNSDLNLESKGLEAEQFKQIALELSTNSTLFSLVLSSNNAGDAGAVALANALGPNMSLAYLWLDHNNIGDVGIAALGQSLKLNQSLFHLTLCGNSIGAAGLTSLAEALKINSDLTYLDMDSCSINDEGAAIMAKAIERNTKLARLSMKNNAIGSKGASAILEALNDHNTTLWSVCLRGITIISAAIHSAISDVTEANRLGVRLLHAETYLFVSDKTITFGAANQIAKELAVNTTLNVLVLNRIDINGDGAVVFANALASNRALNELDLSGTVLDEAGVSAIAKALCENYSLQCLLLTNTELYDDGAIEIAEMLKRNSSLVKLMLASNFVHDAGAAAIARALKVNSTLTELDLTGNIISDPGATALLNTLNEHNCTLERMGLGDNLLIARALQKSIHDVLGFNSWLAQLRHNSHEVKENLFPLVIQVLHQRGSCRRRPRRAHHIKASGLYGKKAAGIIFMLVKTAATTQTL
jgi:NLR family CARD domain-containing protein 3